MYANQKNSELVNKIKSNNKKHIARQEENNKMSDTSFTSHLEGAALKDSSIVGGSGYAAATLLDAGFEKTNGAIGDAPQPKKRKSKKQEVGGAILGIADIETDPRGDPPMPAPLEKTAPKASKTKAQKPVKIKSEMPSGNMEGGASPVKSKRVNPYAILVKEIMEKNKLSLPEASKYIKENNLYKKK